MTTTNKLAELKAQATTDILGVPVLDAELYGRLIVQECIAKYNEWEEHSSDKTSFRMACHGVKRHFGVE